MDVKNAEGSSLSVFSPVRLFHFFFKKKGSPIHQYFDILKSFCYFWVSNMAPTWPGPGLFNEASAMSTTSTWKARRSANKWRQLPA